MRLWRPWVLLVTVSCERACARRMAAPEYRVIVGFAFAGVDSEAAKIEARLRHGRADAEIACLSQGGFFNRWVGRPLTWVGARLVGAPTVSDLQSRAVLTVSPKNIDVVVETSALLGAQFMALAPDGLVLHTPAEALEEYKEIRTFKGVPAR